MLATTRADGAPQVSMLAYHWDGRDVVMSTRSSSAKWANVGRRAQVVVTVQGTSGDDDHRHLALAGRAERIDRDPRRRDLTIRLLESLLPVDRAVLQADVDAGLDARRRVVIRLVPERVTGRA